MVNDDHDPAGGLLQEPVLPWVQAMNDQPPMNDDEDEPTEAFGEEPVIEDAAVVDDAAVVNDAAAAVMEDNTVDHGNTPPLPAVGG